MNNKLIPNIAFVLGLAAILWVAASYATTNPWVLAVLLLIAIAYVFGALELRRYRQETRALADAVDALDEAPATLDDWLVRLPAALRNLVRMRVEGARYALPGPVMSAPLAGLLVLLGMLGTLLGMMATLRGTGIALETATDLQAVRDALAAPVKGLGFAFGTSIAGVATSAMLGLMSALARRERQALSQRLDAAISGPLHAFTHARRREETFDVLRQHAAFMPALVERLHGMAAAIEQQDRAASERQDARQQEFHQRTEAVYTALAASVERSLRDSIAQGADAASRALQPMMQATMAEIASGTQALQATLAASVQRHLDESATGFKASTDAVAAIWTRSLEDHRQAVARQNDVLGEAIERLGNGFDARSNAMLDGLSNRLDASVGAIANGWEQALAQQQDASRQAASENRDALQAAAAGFGQHSTDLLQALSQSQDALQAALAEQEQQRLSAWTQALSELGAALREEWRQVGEAGMQRQQQIHDAMVEVAQASAEQARVHGADTIGEVSRLVEAASQAPRAAAEVVESLRQSLSDSLVRDTAMLHERNQLLETLGTLLDAVNHASNEQKTAIDALVGRSAELLDRIGTRFAEQVETETGKIGDVAVRVSAGAVEVASLGEAFGAAVESFGEVNGKLAERLERIEGALEKSLARSDEQLAYYVAQAREVVDLSLLAQKHIIDDLRQLAEARAAQAA